MNFLDIIIIVPCIYFGWNGFKKGFVISLFTLLALLVGLYAGIHFSDFLCQWFVEKDILTGKYTPPISFTLVFLVVGAVVYFIGVLIQKLIKVAQLNTLNKVIGMFLGLIKAAYILSFVMILTESYDVDNKLVTKEIKLTIPAGSMRFIDVTY